MRTLPDDDLFTPTLTAGDDAAGFDEPWNPWSLVVLTFFFGLIAGGWLLAWNYARLGMPRKLVPATGLLVLVCAAVLAAVELRLMNHLGPPGGTTRVLATAAFKGLETLIVAGVAYTQRRRYQLFLHSRLPEGKLLWYAVGAVLVSLTLEFLMRLGMFFLLPS
jgi:hypothetical protein